MLQRGSTAASATATMPSATASRFGIPPPRREETGQPPLEEQDDGDEDRDLAEDRTERQLDPLDEAAEPRRSENRPRKLADTTGDDDHERVHDVVLAEGQPDVADLNERAAS